ncbi:hypothetical protein ACTVZO_43835 [Streptomyces sp. IBSNAI002]|uniref:hypothetical protein n=1 Tax=Streptomyces sp. IBSNAI002 TaxID=3457500 RepID=UPI003FD35AF3
MGDIFGTFLIFRWFPPISSNRNRVFKEGGTPSRHPAMPWIAPEQLQVALDIEETTLGSTIDSSDGRSGSLA